MIPRGGYEFAVNERDWRGINMEHISPPDRRAGTHFFVEKVVRLTSHSQEKKANQRPVGEEIRSLVWLVNSTRSAEDAAPVCVTEPTRQGVATYWFCAAFTELAARMYIYVGSLSPSKLGCCTAATYMTCGQESPSACEELLCDHT